MSPPPPTRRRGTESSHPHLLDTAVTRKPPRRPGQLLCPDAGTLVGRRHSHRTPPGQPPGPREACLPSTVGSFIDTCKLFDSLRRYKMDSADEFFFHNVLCDFDDSLSDDEEEILAVVLVHHHLNSQRRLFRGSISRHLPALNRNRESDHFLLWKDYLDTTKPLFKHQKFRRRFCMSRHLFNRIRERVVRYDEYFECKEDALGKIGFSSYQKCTAAVRMLAYGVPGDLIDEYVHMSESTCLDSMYKFCKAVIVVFGPEYLREPTPQDTTRLLAMNASRGFPGMLCIIDCMHWEWKNCPSAWKRQYKGHVRACTVILEAVASQDLWIWHSFFGMAGSHNDINVLQRSPVCARLAEGNSLPVNVTINGHNYDKRYYLGDGIYPQWAIIVKTIPNPVGEKRKRFAQLQESVRNDVEHAFGVLQSRWAIVRFLLGLGAQRSCER